MKPRLLVVSSDETVNGHFCNRLGDTYCPVFIQRKNLIPENRIAITHDDILLDRESVLHDITAAVILDSGYMWPQLVTTPDAGQWEIWKDRFDEYLRNEREERSMWFSILHIITESVPLCINPQQVYELAAFKPYALQLIQQAGVACVPMYCGNDRDRAVEWALKSNGVLKRVPTSDIPDGSFFTMQELKSWDFSAQPLTFQILPTDKLVTVISVGTTIIPVEPIADAVPDLDTTVKEIQKTVGAPMLALQFTDNEEKLLVDIDPSPNGIFSDSRLIDFYFIALDTFITSRNV